MASVGRLSDGSGVVSIMDGFYQDFGRPGHDAWHDASAPEPHDAAASPPDPLRMLRQLDRAGIGLFECDLKTERLSWTRTVYDVFGLPERGFHRGDVVELYDPESREVLDALRSRAIEMAGAFTLDAKITRPDGADRWIQITAEVEYAGGRPVRLSGTKRDITEQRREQERLRIAAETDGLTGLSNRAAFQTRFLDSSPRNPGLHPLGALVLIDVDGFKQVNDHHGHIAGDACLSQFGQRLRQAFPDALMTARIGGDEFAVLLPSNRHLPRVSRRVKDANALLRTPIFWNGRLLTIGASHGIAVAENAFTYDAEAMFLRADQALYAAKRARKPGEILPVG